MQSITIFGDIHGNLPALEAVLADIDAHKASPLYCLGDLVGYGTFPNEVTEIIRERKIPTIMGNYDQGVGNNSDDCGCAYTSKEAEALGKRSIAWTNQNTTEVNKLFLRQLPANIPLRLGGYVFFWSMEAPARSMNTYLPTDLTPLWNAF